MAFKAYLQYHASMMRILTEKRRNPCVTLCEFFSHLFIFILLLGGYNLSTVYNIPAARYDVINIYIPPSFVTTALLNETRLSPQGTIRAINSYLSGPLPIPTFDEFVTITKYFSSYAASYSAIASQTGVGQKYQNLIVQGSLHFAPAGEEVSSLISYLKTTTATFNSLTYYVHQDEQSGLNFIMSHLDERTLAFIILREITPEKVNYVIRQNYSTLPNTNKFVNTLSIGLNTGYQSYFTSGFFSIQSTVDQWAYNYTQAINNTDINPKCSLGSPNSLFIPYPTKAYNQNPFFSEVGYLLGLAIAMSTLYPVSRTVKGIVEEKELKLRELMKIMGLQAWIHQLSWFTSTFVLFLWVAITATFFSKISFAPKSNTSIVFAFYFLFALSEISFAFFISVFFSNSKLASIVSPVILFAAILPRYIFFTTNNNEQYYQKFGASLLSPTALSFGAS